MSTSSGRLVYSTDAGRMCPDCRQPLMTCLCRQKATTTLPAGDGVLRVARERAGRGGKTVTVVRGAVLVEADLQALGKKLKAACGSGGTVKDGVIEIQGDHADKAVAWLAQQGFRVKRSGG